MARAKMSLTPKVSRKPRGGANMLRGAPVAGGKPPTGKKRTKANNRAKPKSVAAARRGTAKRADQRTSGMATGMTGLGNANLTPRPGPFIAPSPGMGPY